MTKLLEKAIEAVRDLPDDRQDVIARAILALANEEPEPIDPSDRAAVLEGLEQVKKRQFASPERVAKLLGLSER
jgi:hypothetical protein